MCVLPIDHLLLSGVLETRREGEKEILYTHTQDLKSKLPLGHKLSFSLTSSSFLTLSPSLSRRRLGFRFFGGEMVVVQKKKDAAADKEEWIYLAIIGIVIGGF